MTKSLPSFDLLLVLPSVGLGVISLFITASTAPDFFNSQLIFLLFGIILFVFVSLFPIHSWMKLSWILYGISLILLFLSQIGPEVRGASRWIEVAGFRLQPSEIIKPFIILAFSAQITRQSLSRGSTILGLLGMTLPVLFLIFVQPDLGNVIVLSAIFFTLFFIGGLPWRIIMVLTISFLIILPVFWQGLRDYQRERIYSFVDPDLDPKGAGYNALQSMIALGSGKMMGYGLGHGTQSKLQFLPEYHTDFVFASTAEELGFVGVSAVLVLYLLLLGRILFISSYAEDMFTKLVVLGVFMQIFIQVFINIGMNTGILPITGITLPLLSYGGSSILSTFFNIGLVKASTGHRRKPPLVIR